MAVSLGQNGEMKIVLSVKDDGSVVVEKFGDNAEDSFKKTGKGADEAGKKWEKFSKGSKKYALAIVAAATAITVATVGVGAGFEQSMANTASVASASESQLKRLSNAAREQAKVSIFSASQAADAQYFLASSGLSVNQIISAQAGVMALAAATQSDLAQTSEITTATLAQFGLQAADSDRVANVFAATISGSQATMQKLGDAMRYVGPVANALDQDLESTSAALAVLFNAGFKGEQAGTILRASMIALQKPSSEAAGLIKNMGLEINDASGKFVGFESLIEQLADKQITLNEAATIFGAEAAPGMLAMVKQGAGAYREMRKQITGTNKAQEMANRQTDTAVGDWKLLKSALEESSLILYEEIGPAVRAVTQHITGMISEMNEAEPTITALGTTLKTLASIGIGVSTTFEVVGDAIGSTLAAVALAIDGEFSQALDTLNDSTKFDKIIESSAKTIDGIWAAVDRNKPASDESTTDDAPIKGQPDAPVSGRGTRESEETTKLRDELLQQVDLLAESFLSENELVELQYENELFLLSDALQDKAITTQDYQNLMLSIEEAYQQSLTDIQAKGQSEQHKMWVSGWQGKLNVTSSVLGSLSNLMQSSSKKEFEIGKKAAQAKIAMDTATGAIGAYQSLASIPYVGPVLGVLAAAAVISYGNTQFQKVGSTQFGGGSTASAPAIPTFSATTSSPTDSSFDEPSQFGSTQTEPAPQITRNLTLKAEGSIDPVWMRDVFVPEYEKAKLDGAADVNILVVT